MSQRLYQRIETFALDAVSGQWLRYGNQRIGEFSVWAGASRVINSGGSTDNNILHFHMWAPPGTVTQVTVSGPGLTGSVLFSKAANQRIENGITYDQFTSPTGTELFTSHVPAVGDTYIFTITKAGSTTTTLVYTQTLQEVMLGAPVVTSPTGHALADANIGNPLPVSWTVPAGINVGDIMLQGQVCTATGCTYVDGNVASMASGTITLPAVTSPVSGYIDVRVHHGGEVFTNCRFEFN